MYHIHKEYGFEQMYQNANALKCFKTVSFENLNNLRYLMYYG